MSDVSVPGLDIWPTEPLGKLCDIIIGRTPSRSRPELWGGEHPWLSIADMNQGRHIRTTKEQISSLGISESRSRLIPTGTVVLSFKLSIGKVAVLDIDSFTNEAIAALPILSPEKLLRDYLFWTLRSIRLDEEVDAAAKGKTLNKAKLERLEIPLPPLDEQKRIAAVLDKADALRHQRQESLQLTEKLLQSVFIDIFGDPATNPKDWELKDLSRLGTLDRGVSKHRPRNAPELLGGKYPLIQTGEVSNAGLYIRGFQKTYSEIGFKQSKLWPKGTLCITIAANIAKTAILDFDACFPDSVVGFTPYEGVSSSIYVHFLFGFLQAMIEKNAPQAAQKNINLAILRTLRVPAPPYALQQQFERFVSKIIAIGDDQNASLALTDSVFASIQQSAFRGELDLSRLMLDGDVELPVATIAPGHSYNEGVYNRPGFFIAPPEIEAQMMALEKRLDTGPGDSIPWSEEYFKFRILSQLLKPPFNFAEIWDRVFYDMEEAHYDTVKDKVFEYVEAGILDQQFDEERKEIVFHPRP